MKKEMVGEVPGSVLGMVADLAHKLQHGVILPEEFSRFLKRQDPFSVVVDIGQMLADHQTFYHQFFNLDTDFSSVRIPDRQPGFDRLIMVAQGLTPNQVYDVCTQHFPCWRYTEDLNKATKGLNERDPQNGHYAIWVRDRIEADGEHKNKSANQIKEAGLTTETITERILHELKFWSETGDHLDKDNVTNCTGSRRRDGDVPIAGWHMDGFGVRWCDPGISRGRLRSRQVVS